MNAAIQIDSAHDRATADRSVRFQQVFDAHFDYVRRALRRLGVPESEAADETVNTFVAVYQHLDDYDETRPIKPWLYSFAVRFASNHRRGKGRALRALGTPVDCDCVHSEGLEKSTEARELVYLTLEQLSLPLRSVLVMHDLEGMEVGDIASALSIPETTVYTRLRRARTAFSTQALGLVVGDSADGRDATEDARSARAAILSQILVPLPEPADSSAALSPPASAVQTPAGAGLGAGAGSSLQGAFSWLLNAKLVVAAAFACGLGIGAAATVTALRPAAVPTTAHTATFAPVVAASSDLPTRAADQQATVQTDDLPLAVSAPARAQIARPTASASSEPLGLSPLARERLLIDTATAAIARQRPAQALEALAKHAAQFPNGQMTQERTILEARARRMISAQTPAPL